MAALEGLPVKLEIRFVPPAAEAASEAEYKAVHRMLISTAMFVAGKSISGELLRVVPGLISGVAALRHVVASLETKWNASKVITTDGFTLNPEWGASWNADALFASCPTFVILMTCSDDSAAAVGAPVEKPKPTKRGRRGGQRVRGKKAAAKPGHALDASAGALPHRVLVSWMHSPDDMEFENPPPLTCWRSGHRVIGPELCTVLHWFNGASSPGHSATLQPNTVMTPKEAASICIGSIGRSEAPVTTRKINTCWPGSCVVVVDQGQPHAGQVMRLTQTSIDYLHVTEVKMPHNSHPYGKDYDETDAGTVDYPQVHAARLCAIRTTDQIYTDGYASTDQEANETKARLEAADERQRQTSRVRQSEHNTSDRLRREAAAKATAVVVSETSAEGAVASADGAVASADGAVASADGAVASADGAVASADGAVASASRALTASSASSALTASSASSALTASSASRALTASSASRALTASSASRALTSDEVDDEDGNHASAVDETSKARQASKRSRLASAESASVTVQAASESVQSSPVTTKGRRLNEGQQRLGISSILASMRSRM